LKRRLTAITEICLQHRAREVRVARDDRERELLWKAGKTPSGALGRLSPTYYVQDGVIPRTRLPETLRCIEESAANTICDRQYFSAGDGTFIRSSCSTSAIASNSSEVVAAGIEIIRSCVEVGGALQASTAWAWKKNELMPLMFTPEDLDLMRRVRAAFNPAERLNPGKVLPLGKACGEIRVHRCRFPRQFLQQPQMNQ